MNNFHIYTYPRLHFSLIGMNEEGYRINGGIGCSISNPVLDCYFERSDDLNIIDERKYGFSNEEYLRLTNTIESVLFKYNFKSKYKCIISCNEILSHVGLGSNTMIYLSCIEALFILNDIEYDRDTIISNSTRGGTSGVGINTYFDGGVSIDLGINKIGNTIKPSSQGSQKEIPLQLCGFAIPQWPIGLMIPTHIPRQTEEQEISFFKTHTSIEMKDVKDILYEVIYGVASSLKTQDFSIFCKSIDNLQKTKWKKLEWETYGEELRNIENFIKEAGAISVGMSSLGPMLYFLGDNIEHIINRLKQKYKSSIFIETTFNNNSRKIIYGT